MNSGGATMSKELLDFFDFNKNTPSVSAFTQQRSKVRKRSIGGTLVDLPIFLDN